MKMPFGFGSTAAVETASDRTRRTHAEGADGVANFLRRRSQVYLFLGCARACHAMSRISSSLVFVLSSRYFCGNVTFSPLPKLRFLLHLRFCRLRLARPPRNPALHCTAFTYVYGNLGHLRFADSCRCRRRTRYG